MTAEAYGKQKVVYHFSTHLPEKNKNALKFIQNHINAVGEENINVIALVHASAWVILARKKVSEEMAQMIESLVEQGVDFRLCENTRIQHKLDLDHDLVVPVSVAKAGVAELAMLQAQGYAYIKP
ncbi:DsrE family protein [Dethiosulfatarculus sandiegensis]|uniref:DsrE family protein n=1 Tax=Dethiosulfatarculus sandiegensis TaxID=1429043 RepID=UPI00069728C6|nr:DsrE family protein [Dethiosulfatarculus sandiegensis]